MAAGKAPASGTSETTQRVGNWASRRPALALAIAVGPLLGAAVTLAAAGAASVAIIVALMALAILACGVLMMAVAQILTQLQAIRGDLAAMRDQVDTRLLDDIATDLTAMRTQMGKGVLGLLGADRLPTARS